MLFDHVNIIPMTGEKVIADQSLRVEGKTISAIGPAGTIIAAEGETVIDGNGAYLLPGLADMHMHTRPNWIDGTYPVSPFSLYLANGVTTIRDFGPVGDNPCYVLQWRDEIDQGLRDGPKIYSSGSPLFGPVENPAGMIREQKGKGFDFAKLYSYLTPGEFYTAVATAKEVGMYTAGHIPFAVGLAGALTAGMDEIAHVEELDFELIEFDRGANLSEEEWIPMIMKAAYLQFEIHLGIDIQKVKARAKALLPGVIDQISYAQTPVCTTMIVGSTVFQKLLNPEMYIYRQENKYLSRGYIDAFLRGEDKHQVQFQGAESLAVFKYEIEKMLLTELHRAGLPLLLSTDAGSGELGIVPGFSIHRELQILVDNGFTPYEAISVGTVEAGKVMAKITSRREFGTIESGMRADLILVEENPLEKVAHLKEPLGVMAAGRWYQRETLARMIALNGKDPVK